MAKNKHKMTKDEELEVKLYMEGRAYVSTLGKIGKDGEIKGSRVVKIFEREED